MFPANLKQRDHFGVDQILGLAHVGTIPFLSQFGARYFASKHRVTDSISSPMKGIARDYVAKDHIDGERCK